MSSDKPTRTAKSSTSSSPAPPGDHRKRRRNRTTQSCLNCHASKRMCDRKRPACQRCTTLGLTGLCVYEVDDPSQRDNHLDEKGLLRSRVAELEGVIRELKNKPHPRWAQKAATSLTLEVPSSDDSVPLSPTITIDHTRDVGSADAPDHLSSSPSERNPLHLTIPTPSIRLSPVGLSPGAASSCESLLSPQDSHFLGTYNIPSPASTSSANSPMPAHSALPQVVINDTSSLGDSDFNVEGLFASASLEPSGFEDGLYGQMLDHMMRADQAKSAAFYDCGMDGHSRPGATCGCINNTMAYNYVLELSVRLRKAVEALGRVADHRPGSSGCELYSRMYELDKLTSAAVGEVVSPSDRLTAQSLSTLNNFLSPTNSNHLSTISPLCLSSLQQWESNVHSRTSIVESPDDDSFMAWDGGRQQEWSQHSISL